jgi:hypothetical protein
MVCEFKRRQQFPNDFRSILQARELVFVLSLFKSRKHHVQDHYAAGVRPQQGASWRLGSRPAARFISMLYRFRQPRKKHFCTGKTPFSF